MKLQSDGHYDLYEPASERKNMVKGFLFLILAMAGLTGVFFLMFYIASFF